MIFNNAIISAFVISPSLPESPNWTVPLTISVDVNVGSAAVLLTNLFSNTIPVFKAFQFLTNLLSTTSNSSAVAVSKSINSSGVV